MKKILLLNVKKEGDQTSDLHLTFWFMKEWLSIRQGDSVNYLDVDPAQLPHLNDLWISAAIKQMDLSVDEEAEDYIIDNKLTEELTSADVILLPPPTYKNCMPITLKMCMEQHMYICLVKTDNCRSNHGEYETLKLMSNKQKIKYNIIGIDKKDRFLKTSVHKNKRTIPQGDTHQLRVRQLARKTLTYHVA